MATTLTHFAVTYRVHNPGAKATLGTLRLRAVSADDAITRAKALHARRKHGVKLTKRQREAITYIEATPSTERLFPPVVAHEAETQRDRFDRLVPRCSCGWSAPPTEDSAECSRMWRQHKAEISQQWHDHDRTLASRS